MKISLLSFFIILLSMHITKAQTSYSIQICIKDGSKKLFDYSIDSGIVKIIEYPFFDDVQKLVYEREINEKEKFILEKLIDYIFNAELKESYVYDGVKGQIHFEFTLQYFEQTKNIYVFYNYPEELTRLVFEVNKMIPERYSISFE